MLLPCNVHNVCNVCNVCDVRNVCNAARVRCCCCRLVPAKAVHRHPSFEDPCGLPILRRRHVRARPLQPPLILLEVRVVVHGELVGCPRAVGFAWDASRGEMR